MPLTDTRLRALKAKEAAYRVTDMGGLYLNISPSGKRSWRYDYTFHGRRLTLTIGNYPDVGLADARRNEARRKVTEGINPSEEKRIEKGKVRISTATTFGGVADDGVAIARRRQKSKLEAPAMGG